MRPGSPPTARRILGAALAALVVGAGALALVTGFSDVFPLRLLQGVAVLGAAAVVIALVVTAIIPRLADWRDPASEEEFEALVQHSEELARENVAPEPEEEEFLDLDPADDEEFEQLVAEAIDELPREFREALENVAVVISDGGRRRRAYGLYHGDTVARDDHPDRIVIYRDTLRRDFGHDADMLREEVVRTLRHELGHHLGWDEWDVRRLGL
jgi:predicted Zn-dependent protease with MMP-like domain